MSCLTIQQSIQAINIYLCLLYVCLVITYGLGKICLNGLFNYLAFYLGHQHPLCVTVDVANHCSLRRRGCYFWSQKLRDFFGFFLLWFRS